ncbi:MAG TPA: 3-phosphoshikimate 1-carboxyvinyltransferase [Aliidongia sp.]|nr:3-phosphoshikimate 1-carboxyvinyltransferase [Aliidongia sp.]
MPPQPLIARPSGKLAGTVRVPGDKSMAHHALVLGALAVGRTRIKGLPDSADLHATAAALRALGAQVTRHDDGLWTVDGVGVGGLGEPAQVLDLGTSRTGLCLLMGLVATHPVTAVFTGGALLAKRPMARILRPLEMMGAQFVARRGGLLPITAIGAALPMPIDYRLPVASAQVKSAILLAGLNAAGTTGVIEPWPTRDHTERMLRTFGARVTVEPAADGGSRILLTGQPELAPATLDLPADPSSAALPMVAALALAGSDVTLLDVALNPLRTGLISTLQEMGAAIEILNPRQVGNEPVGDLRVRASRLKGITVPAERAPSMIEEYPILAAAAAQAAGVTVFRGLNEFRAREGERLTAVVNGLAACGVRIAVDHDTLTIQGAGGPVPGGSRIETGRDHRVAMAFLALGLGAKAAVEIDDAAAIETSFPDFAGLMRGLGADISTGTF